jgi:di/tricarboxylate transporter
MLLFAVAKPNVWEKVQAIPTSTWVNLLIGLAVLFLLVRIWKSLAEINEFAPWLVLILVGGSVVLYWTYERTEPKPLSPVFDFLAEYLPSRPSRPAAPDAPDSR